MTLDRLENDQLREVRNNPASSPETSKPKIGGRFINICRGLAQKAMAFPNPKKYPNTLKLANGDNNLIDKNTEKIASYEYYIQNYDTSRVGDMFGPSSIVDEFAESIANMEAEIDEVKTTYLTSEQITDKDRFKIKVSRSIPLKLE